MTLILAPLLSQCSEPDPPAQPDHEAGAEAVLPPLPRPAPGAIESAPLAPRQAGSGSLFQAVPADHSGIDFIHRWAPRNKQERERIAGPFAGGAVALGDLDHDGLPEVLLTRPHGGSRLYRNLGGLRFADITAEAGLDQELSNYWATGATFVDLQGDGHLDLYVCAYAAPNKLFINTGEGRFEERAAEHGLAFSGASIMMSFADYDRDGDLDAHLLTNRLAGGSRPAGLEFQVINGVVITPEPYRDEVGAVLRSDGTLHPVDAGQADRLYRNDGGTFTEVAASAGLTGHWHGLSATWWDYDADGWIDLYVANDFFGPDHLYHNNRDGTFTDVIAEAVPNTPWFSMGSDAGDLDGDGRLDLIATDMAATTHYKQKVNMGDMDEEGWFLETSTPPQYMRNTVYLNTGTPRFLEVAQMAGLSSTDWTWAVRIADYDADGHNDVFFSNGMTRQFFHADLRAEVRQIHALTGENRWGNHQPQKETNRLFRNRGDLTFEDVSRPWGISEETVSFGAAAGDLDGDGDLDLVVNNFEAPVQLYRNTSAAGNLIKIALSGTGSNRDAVGAELRLTAGSREHVRVLQPVRGFMGCDPPEAVFGLGDQTVAQSLTIRWPSGLEQTVKNLSAGQRYLVSAAGDAAPIAAPPDPDPLFEEFSMPKRPHHLERAFDDFALQPLLPNRLSRLGPAMAWGDLDGNGKPDCFLGGASGHPAQLWLQSGEGKWYRQRIPFFDDHAACEDLDAVLFDADGDRDLDLYVVSGGVEGLPGSDHYQDRLYLGLENGLTAAPADALPDMNFSGGCVAVGDFEGDGDPDLFVGARVLPGQYPLSAPSRLLLNDGSGRFADAPPGVISSLPEAGMVTDALWSDTDRDQDLDLLVTTEYGPVRYYRNEGGVLTDATATAGLADRLGWWTCIAAADLDLDGDLDYAVGNFGLNTKYHPTPEAPQRLYYGDFDGSGKSYCVEAHLADGMLVPNRGRSCSSGAMPFIGRKFSKFHTFALAELAEIYPAPKLQSAHRFEANELASGILRNDGSGKFQFSPLPRLAQVAPIFGLAFLDANRDGKIDLYASQNFYGPQRETGRMAGGVGLLLLGTGDGTFQPLGPKWSGILIPEDARGAVAVDLNADGAEDLAVAVNNGPLRMLVNRRDSKNK